MASIDGEVLGTAVRRYRKRTCCAAFRSAAFNWTGRMLVS